MQGTAATPRLHHVGFTLSLVLRYCSRGDTTRLHSAGMGVPSAYVSLLETLSSESTTRGGGMLWEGTLGPFRIRSGQALERDWLLGRDWLSAVLAHSGVFKSQPTQLLDRVQRRWCACNLYVFQV
jgi:hypothetical protein